MSLLGLPHYDSGIVDVQYTHILRAPYQSVVFPHSEKVHTEDVLAELYENADYQSEYFNQIPQGTNPHATVGYGHAPGVSSNALLKRRKNVPVRGLPGYEPRWQPPSGWGADYVDPRMPEEYYDMTHRRPDYVDLPAIDNRFLTEMAIPQPNPKVLGPGQLPVPITPNASYNLDLQPILGDEMKARPMIIKPTTAVGNVSNVAGGYETPNPTQLTKYIRAREIVSFLTPMVSTYVKIGEAIYPVKFRDPNYTIVQAQNELPIDVPLPDGNFVKLKDYSWTIVQNVNSPTELIFEVPVQLKEKPDTAHAVSQISAAYSEIAHQDLAPLPSRRVDTSVTPPVTDQISNYYLSVGATGKPLARPSRLYTAVSDGFELMPSGLQPVQVELRKRPELNIQPEPTFTYPWNA